MTTTMNGIEARGGWGGTFAGMRVHIVDAQKQARTPRDVKGPWVRPRVPNKLAGRQGTRRAYKRCNPPHQTWLFREPDDVLVIRNETIIATPLQADAMRREARGLKSGEV